MLSLLGKSFRSFLPPIALSEILLLGLAAAALFMANSQWREFYESLNHLSFSFNLGPYFLKTNAHQFINDGLMSVFFFVVGMEVKMALREGELSSPKKAALPIMAAIGGCIVPAAIYYFLNRGLPTEGGWGIPIATDIAFALGLLSLMSKKVPLSLKVFLLCLAIIDDIVAVLVIALFYSKTVSGPFLGLACIVCFAVWLYFKIGLNNKFVLASLALALWVCVFNSGLHATLSGVVLGFLIPSQKQSTGKQAIDAASKAFSRGAEPDIQQIKKIGSVAWSARSPLQNLIDVFHPYVNYLIIPLFAFSNAGIAISSINLESWIQAPVSYGVIIGLCVGKPIGIALFSYLSCAMGIAQLPQYVNWRQIISVGFLGGIGFTMSLFITNLSFDLTSEIHSFAKLSILAASGFSGIMGLILLAFGKNVPKSQQKK